MDPSPFTVCVDCVVGILCALVGDAEMACGVKFIHTDDLRSTGVRGLLLLPYADSVVGQDKFDRTNMPMAFATRNGTGFLLRLHHSQRNRRAGAQDDEARRSSL